MPASSFCTSHLSGHLCGLLNVILPIVGGVLGLLALYVLVRYWDHITRLVSRLLFLKSTPPTPTEMNLNAVEKGRVVVNGRVANGGGVSGVGRSAIGEPQTFEPNCFFLRQNSLNETADDKSGEEADAAGTPGASADSKRRLSKSHPACSPTFQTDPIDWADLGIKLPKGKEAADQIKK